jgi:transposase InsO family protein
MIDELKASYPVVTLCRILEVPRSSYYKVPIIKKGDQVLLAAIEKIILKWPYYGYRRMTHELKREGYLVGETRIRRLLHQIDHSCSVGKASISTTDSQHEYPHYPNLIKHIHIDHLNQVWVADITYIRFERKFIYLAVILDAFSRGVRGWSLGRNIDRRLTISAVEKALAAYPAPEFHHSDQGSQYATPDYTASLPFTRISMSAKGRPTENGIVERFIRTFKEEHIDYTEYDSFPNAVEQIKHWLEIEYMTERIHSSLAYLTPFEFETAQVIQKWESPISTPE